MPIKCQNIPKETLLNVCTKQHSNINSETNAIGVNLFAKTSNLKLAKYIMCKVQD